MRKKNAFLLLFLCAVLFLILAGCGGKKSQETETPAPDTEPPVEEASTAEPTTASLEDIITALQSSMEANVGENFSLTQDGESLRVDVWRDGLGANVNEVVAAGTGIPEQWTTIVNSFQSMSASIQNILDANGYQNISVAFNVLSELDKHTLLLSIVRDTVVYDFLAENANVPAQQAQPAVFVLDAAAIIESEIYGTLDTGNLELQNGELLSVIYGGDGVFVVKAKIESSYSNDATIKQNYFSVCDLIKKHGFNACRELQYWAVMDTASGDEIKVINFTLDESVIQAVASGAIVENQLGDYASDLYIAPLLT